MYVFVNKVLIYRFNIFWTQCSETREDCYAHYWASNFINNLIVSLPECNTDLWVLPHVAQEHTVSGNFLHPRYSLSLFLPSKHFAQTWLLRISWKLLPAGYFLQTTLAANNSNVVKFTPRHRFCPIIITSNHNCDILVSSFGGNNLKLRGRVGSVWSHRWTWQHAFLLAVVTVEPSAKNTENFCESPD